MKVGVLGAGQLGRMLALAGYPLGLDFRFYDSNPDSPARSLGEFRTGGFEDAARIRDFCAGLDVVTTEFENVPAATAAALPADVPFFPGAGILATAQDRLPEKELFRRLGIRTAPYVPVDPGAGAAAVVAAVGLPLILKTRRLGYDGKGQRLVRTAAELTAALAALGQVPLIAEGVVAFTRELSIIAVRGRDGAMVFYPLVENEHRAGILWRSVAPAPGAGPDLQSAAEAMARRVMDECGYVGVLVIELFDTAAGLVANEMAPRVHNSGHWTIEGAVCSQFENHLRAVTGLPLGPAEPRGAARMYNILHELPDVAGLLALPGVHVHLYGKAPRPGRKLGHVTVCGEDAARVAAVAERVEAVLAPGCAN